MIRGAVERLDEERGVSGWMADLSGGAVEVELWAGGVRLAMCKADRKIANLADDIPSAARGFAFGEDALAALRRAATAGGNGAVEVRVAGRDRPLPSSAPPLDLSFIRFARGPAGRGSDADFLARLADLRAQAVGLSERSLRPDPTSRAGFIEVAAADEGGLVWVLGWMERDARHDRPVAILETDGSPASAGFAYVTIPRADVPESATGLIGVLQTDWRPSRGSKPFFFISEGDATHLEGLDPLELVSKAHLAQHCLSLWGSAGLGYVQEIRRLMQQVRSWDILPQEVSPEMAAVEEVLVLPGFGCFATGWTLSPTRQVDRLVLRLGNAVLVADPASMATKARPDLAHILPGADRLVDHAGFTAVFPGDVDADALSDAVLKVVYRDGTSTNHPVAPAAMRRLGETTGWDRVRQFYPGIAAEPFFPAFADAARVQHAAQAGEVRVLAIEPCTQAVVLAVPSDRSDAFLRFDGIARAEKALPQGVGIVLIAGHDDDRAATIGLFNDLKAAVSRSLSLVFVRDAAMAAYALPALAPLLGLDRFLFVGGTVMLGAEGWRAASNLDGKLAFLDLADPAREDDVGEPGLDCFAWDVASFAAWLATTRPLIGGAAMLPPDPALLAGARRIAAGASRTRIASPSTLIQAINRSGARA